MTAVVPATAGSATDDDLAASLRTYQESGATRSVTWRRAQLEGLLRLIRENDRRLTDALATDVGKPRLEAWAADLAATVMDLSHVARGLEAWMRPRRHRAGKAVFPGTAHLVPEPLGAVLVIAPWNYPVQLSLMPVGAALAAGNCVALKPSELAPATAHALADLLPRYVDQQAVHVVEGGIPETTGLLVQRWDHILYTGNGRVGRVVARAAAEHLTPTTLELGGKSPVIVDRDADLDIAARRITWGKLLNAGQTCLAPDHVLVHEAVAAELEKRLLDRIRVQYGDDPIGNDDLGRIVSRPHFDRIAGAIDASGGRVACGGQRDATALKIAPTVIVDPDADEPLMTEEIFGPVLPVVRVPDVDAAIEQVRAGDKPLALYAFTASRATAHRIIEGTSSGGVCINATIAHTAVPDLPFGGVGESGHGRYHGRAGFDTFSNLRGVVRKSTRPDPSLLYPPFSAIKEKALRLVLR